MIESPAKVMRTDGDVAYVEVRNSSGCGSCGVGKECPTILLSQVFGGAKREFRVRNDVGAKAGESVVVGLEEGALLKGSLTMYLLPLLLLFIGAVSSMSLAPSAALRDVYSIVGGGVGLVTGFIWVKLYATRLGANRHFQPVILRKSGNEFFCAEIKEG